MFLLFISFDLFNEDCGGGRLLLRMWFLKRKYMELECDGVGEEFDRFGVLWKFFFVDDISIVYVFVIVGDDDVMDCISGLFINLSGRFKIV